MSSCMRAAEFHLSNICSCQHRSVGLRLRTHTCAEACCPPEPEVRVDIGWGLTVSLPQVQDFIHRGKTVRFHNFSDCRVKSWSEDDRWFPGPWITVSLHLAAPSVNMLVYFCGIFLLSLLTFYKEDTVFLFVCFLLCCYVCGGEMCNKSFTVQKSIPLSVINKDALK